jgi:hypothetical protein
MSVRVGIKLTNKVLCLLKVRFYIRCARHLNSSNLDDVWWKLGCHCVSAGAIGLEAKATSEAFAAPQFYFQQ